MEIKPTELEILYNDVFSARPASSPLKTQQRAENCFLKVENDIEGIRNNNDNSENSNQLNLFSLDYSFTDYELPSKYSNDDEIDDRKQHELLEICRDPDLRNLLILNRRKRMKLKQLYNRIQNILSQCHANMGFKKNSVDVDQLCDIRRMNRIWRLGIPYFKRRDDFPCPRNADTIKKLQNGELMFYDMTPTSKWTEKDSNRLLIGVSFHYKTVKETEITKQIERLEAAQLLAIKKDENEIPVVDTATDSIMKLKKDLQHLQKVKELTTFYPPLDYTISLVDWDRISKTFLLDRYSVEECQLQWTICLHPDVNKSKWTNKESEKLEKIAAKYNYQNWDLIAKELGTNRSGYMVCTHYYVKVNPTRHGRFTVAEDNLILELVDRYKQGNYIPWNKVTQYFKNRTRAQLFYRYRYFLCCQKDSYRGKFKESEDILILILVDRFGKQFSKFKTYFPNRTIVQIKSRYTANLRAPINKGSFTIEEDRLILKYYNEKERKPVWEHFANKLKRSTGQIRQRYQTLIAFLQANPSENLEKAPRRKYKTAANDIQYEFVRHMANKFKDSNQIPTLEEIEALIASNTGLKSLYQSNENSRAILDNNPLLLPALDCVDGLLIDYFSNSIKLNFQKNINPTNLSDVTENVMSLLANFQAKLYLPKDFRNNPKLDFIDIEILNYILLEMTPNKPTDDNCLTIDTRNLNLTLTDKIVAPNLNTMIAMRSLLINNTIYRSTKYGEDENRYLSGMENNEEIAMEWCLDNYLINLPSREENNHLLFERELFFKRFVMLFKLPAIMTLQKPLVKLTNESSMWEENSKILQTYQKKRPAAQTDLKIIPLNSNHSIPKLQTETVTVTSNNLFEQQVDIADKLKKRINDTIKELSNTPPKIRFRHMT